MTINDIARICGVSKGTVNRALHDKPGIRSGTKAAILRVVEEQGFSPDHRAKSLATGKTQTIGLLLPNIINQAFATIATLIEKEFWEKGYLLHLALSNDDASREELYLGLFLNRKIDGLIIFPVNSEAQALERIIDAGIPVVILLNNLAVSGTDSVLLDERQAVISLTRYVLSLGHRRILYLDGYRRYTRRYNDYINRERYTGMLEAFREAGLDPAGALSILEFDPLFYGYGDMKPLEGYFSDSRRPSAVICFHDRIAVWLMVRLERAGFRVPDDISLTGFDDIEELQDLKLGLTTLRNPLSAIARGALRLLLEQIEGGRRFGSRITLETELIIRDSCRAL
jgi:DNA-binding LacI/PurR family transcriptional regulator